MDRPRTLGREAGALQCERFELRDLRAFKAGVDLERARILGELGLQVALPRFACDAEVQQLAQCECLP